ncbi:MAG: hypothetical protein ACXVZ1_02500 [Gaiellaceae bacterium]
MLVVGLALLFVFPLIVLLAELLIALFAVGLKLLLGRWTVVAESGDERLSWPIRGGARAAALAAEVAAALQTGLPLPDPAAPHDRRPATARFGVRATGSSGHVVTRRRGSRA